MATRVEIVIDADTKPAEGKLGGLRGILSGLGGVAQTAIGVALGGALMAIPGLASKAAGAIGGMFQEGAQVAQVRNTFNSLNDSIGEVSDTMLKDLRKATRGMVSDSKLMAASNKFVSMGLADTSEEASGLAEIATQLGMAMGEDATASMENFALMMANQSIPRLDSFGISSGRVRERIEELTEANEDLTREQAFMQAVMEEAQVTLGRVGEQAGGAAGSIARIKSATQNMKDSMGEAVAVALGPFIEKLATFVSEHAPKVAAWLGTHIPLAVDELRKFVEGPGMVVINWLKEKIPQAVAVATWFWNNVIKKAFEGMATFITNDLLPALRDVWSWLQEKVAEAAGWLSTKVDELAVSFSNVVTATGETGTASLDLIEKLTPLGVAITGFTADVLGELLTKLGELTTFVTTEMFGWLDTLGVKIGIDQVKTWGDFKVVVGDLWGELEKVWKSITDALGKAQGWEEPLEWLRGAFQNVADAASAIASAVGSVIGKIKELISTLGELELPTWLQGQSPPPLANWLGDIAQAAVEASVQVGGLGQAVSPAVSNSETYHHYNLTINSQATMENLAADFNMMQALAGV